MSRATTAVLIALVVLLVITSLSMFTVDQRQNAIVFRLGEPVQVIVKPGLYFKMPLLDNVRLFDVRILTLDPDEPERFITSEKKNVLVDSFVKWRIIDVVQYYISVNGDESRAKIRLAHRVLVVGDHGNLVVVKDIDLGVRRGCGGDDDLAGPVIAVCPQRGLGGERPRHASRRGWVRPFSCQAILVRSVGNWRAL